MPSALARKERRNPKLRETNGDLELRTFRFPPVWANNTNQMLYHLRPPPNRIFKR